MIIKLVQLISPGTLDAINSAPVDKPEQVWTQLKKILLGGSASSGSASGGILGNYILPTAFFVAVLFAIYGGILYFTAYGNEEKATKGRNTFTYAIIGVIIVALAWVIVRFVSQTLFGLPASKGIE